MRAAMYAQPAAAAAATMARSAVILATGRAYSCGDLPLNWLLRCALTGQVSTEFVSDSLQSYEMLRSKESAQASLSVHLIFDLDRMQAAKKKQVQPHST